jgi:hypothetical protein
MSRRSSGIMLSMFCLALLLIANRAPLVGAHQEDKKPEAKNDEPKEHNPG